ncbi:hypothetical protein MMC31_004070 [Peltigera leucophlebia]|nr:hypothetical protein [Peltigera leucophlebia]
MQQPKIETTLDETKGNGMCYLSTWANWICGSQGFSPNELEVDLRDLHDDAARWWAAILAPGEGWRAEIKADGIVYRSPWSICIVASQQFKLRRLASCQDRRDDIRTPPSSEMALEYLSDFCMIHNINTQSSAALAAALHFPYLRCAIATLPLPRPLSHRRSRFKPTNAMPSSDPSSSSAISREMEIFSAESNLLPYYMTLSCNTAGIEALLCGAFFDPQVTCNLVSSWIEPIFEVIDPLVAKSDYKTLTIVMGKRQPKLAALWTGAFISGVAKNIFPHVRIGLLRTEIHSSAWTGTAHSFISLKPTTFVSTETEMLRSDESRLLYLAQCDEHCRLPVSPWKPFGATPLGDTEIEVRQHARCTGHYLQYMGWAWDLIDGPSLENQGFMIGTQDQETCAATTNVLLPDSEEFWLPKSEELSEYATRSIFHWLRVSGWPQAEQNIYSHSWIVSESEGSDDELDDKLGDESSANGHRHDASITKVEDWLGRQ